MIPQSSLSPPSVPEDVDCTDRVTQDSQISAKQTQDNFHVGNYNAEDGDKKSYKHKDIDDSRVRQAYRHCVIDNENTRHSKLKEKSSNRKMKRKKRIRPNDILLDNSASILKKKSSIKNDYMNPSSIQYSPTTEVTVKKKQKHRKSKSRKSVANQANPIKRRSLRGNSSIGLLAHTIVNNKKVVFITGAGLSVKSGIRPFRGNDGLWAEVVWSNATREAFRKNPLDWYNNFWLNHFPPLQYNENLFQPNNGHEALAELTNLPNTNLFIITQNVDGLHSKTKCKWNWNERLIEAHGRVGLFKCIPTEDSDGSDYDGDDDEEDRLVKLGNRKKSRELINAILKNEREKNKQAKIKEQYKAILTNPRGSTLPPRKRWCQMLRNMMVSSSSSSTTKKLCRYQILDSIPIHKIQPLHVQDVLLNHCNHLSNKNQDENNEASIKNDDIDTDTQANSSSTTYLNEPPRCLNCGNPCPPQALLFDEGYHSHAFYRFMDMEEWIGNADALVFVGTSFAVTVTDVALSHARERYIPVYNFNLDNDNGRLESTSRLNVENIMGDASITLPNLLQACKDELKRTHQL